MRVVENVGIEPRTKLSVMRRRRSTPPFYRSQRLRDAQQRLDNSRDLDFVALDRLVDVYLVHPPRPSVSTLACSPRDGLPDLRNRLE